MLPPCPQPSTLPADNLVAVVSAPDSECVKAYGVCGANSCCGSFYCDAAGQCEHHLLNPHPPHRYKEWFFFCAILVFSSFFFFFFSPLFLPLSLQYTYRASNCKWAKKIITTLRCFMLMPGSPSLKATLGWEAFHTATCIPSSIRKQTLALQ